ncbi:hypothetical protein NJC38_20210 [Pseudomonas sp. 21LCFQ010]|uniref:hypothetical protein n=1 Tax=Pseudomonas sp. 21LCFQ010 TaxID=2957506 RepID=UPI002097E90B|nr:hypothetical protein [Pseudomonas sp. 21LCFQ010]MCO8164465.1 hypothetical protein [Pseudomonas sp. 21LCFQ010]
MHRLLGLSLLLALLSSCAVHPERNSDGVWINQAAINAAVGSHTLRRALWANDSIMEWHINTHSGRAVFVSAIERGEGIITRAVDNQLDVRLDGVNVVELRVDQGQLFQTQSLYGPPQRFSKSTGLADAQPGSRFIQALNSAYLDGSWSIVSGEGQGRFVRFLPDGRVQGLADNERYQLCLGGDCASMSGANDSLWLEKSGKSELWFFVRNGRTLEIFHTVNTARSDEKPVFVSGARRWLLERQ